MKILVQKFGGTSLNTAESRRRVADIIRAHRDEGYAVAVVVSAIGRRHDPYATDTLLDFLKSVNPDNSPREQDMMLACGEIISGVILSAQLSAFGIDSKFFTGAQAGVHTDGNFGAAHIRNVAPRAVMECLQEGRVAVVAGFQGVSGDGELTTLGRGGSDTTAAALAVALNAECIDIFTDVDGVMTADPRIVKDARLIDALTYNEICQLAREGAKIVHPRAVEIAMQKGVPLRVRSTFSDSRGTMVSDRWESGAEEVTIRRDRLIAGITHTTQISRIRVEKPVEDTRGEAELKVFKSMAQAGISVDFINVQPEAILYTVAAESAHRAAGILREQGMEPQIEADCAKVAIVGAAMTGIPGVMARVVEAFHEQGIPILQSGDSYTNIWCLVKREYMEQAVMALHAKFQLAD
ncbi:MAG: aspartate kinase [Syntrophomonadaceae bacterium]|nr:aspartate kinase [Syntrophomonadaceae bacterium]